MKKLRLLLIAACAIPAMAWADLQNENLLQAQPPHFKVGFRSSHNGVNSTEFVPENETVDNWTEMLTTQVVMSAGQKPMTPAQFLEGISGQWMNACKGGQMANPFPGQSKKPAIQTGKSNGYVSSTMYLRCPKNPTTGQPENTFFRIIKGNDSLYIVQKAFKSEPTPEQVKATLAYLESVTVCDTRTPEHPCPDLKAQGFEPIKTN